MARYASADPHAIVQVVLENVTGRLPIDLGLVRAPAPLFPGARLEALGGHLAGEALVLAVDGQAEGGLEPGDEGVHGFGLASGHGFAVGAEGIAYDNGFHILLPYDVADGFQEI